MYCIFKLFIFYTIKEFGAVIFIIIMTTRAIPQVMMDWLLYNRTFGWQGWLGVLIVFTAILLRVGNTLRKYRHKLKTERESKLKEAEDDDEKMLQENALFEKERTPSEKVNAEQP